MPPLPADARIGEVSLTVSDLERSVTFYTDVLGFHVIARAGNDASLGAGGPAPLVRLTAHEGAVPRPRRTSGLYHFAILVPDRAALGRSLRRLAERRWPLTGSADHLVSEALYLGHVHLHVPDLARAEMFYCDGVGFSPMLRRYPGALFVAAGGYHHHLGLNVWAGLGAPPPPVNAVGLQGFTIEASVLPPRDERDEATGVTVTVRASLGDAAAADE